MRPVLLASIAGLAALSASSAHADIFNFSYGGNGLTASGSIVYNSGLAYGARIVSGGTWKPDVGTTNFVSVAFNSWTYTSNSDYSVDLMFTLDNSDIVEWNDIKVAGVHVYNREAYGIDGDPIPLDSGDINAAPAPVPGAGLLSLAFFGLVGARSRGKSLLKWVFARARKAFISTRHAAPEKVTPRAPRRP